jgi:hypothetical protein
VTYGLLQRRLRCGHFVVAALSVFAFPFLTISLAVGGSLFDFAAHGEETSQLCQKLLSARHLDPGHLQPAEPNALVINWRALKKWKIPKRLVPGNAIIRFREPSLSEEHRALVVGAAVFAVIETVLILALLRSLARLHRTRHELNDRLRFERLVAGLSARFVNIPPEKVDSEIERSLDQVVDSMK